MKKKSENYNWGVGIALGMGVGVALGTALDNIAIGIALGVGMGVAFAAAFAQEDQKKNKTDSDLPKESLPSEETQSPDDLPSIED